MKLSLRFVLLLFFLMICGVSIASDEKDFFALKPSPSEVLKNMQTGNARFCDGRPLHVDNNLDRKTLAASENQGKYAYATVLACSDSRVPVELIFDVGIMDIFTVRVAGNVCNTDEIGCIEYGVCHVNTPLVIVMGHSQCGAVTAVTQTVKGHGHTLEKNIPPLVESIFPAVRKTIANNPEMTGADLLDACIEESVWTSIATLFVRSPAVCEMVKNGKIKVVGAIYDLESGKVKWLPEEKVAQLFDAAEKAPRQ